MIEMDNISFSYGRKKVLDSVSLDFVRGCFYGIIGPNGSGKTTLVDLLAGHLRPDLGIVRFNGRDLAAFSRKEIARRIALVPQDFRIDFPFSCEEVVMMGRYPHIPRFSRPSAADHEKVVAVMAQTGLSGFAGRFVHQLSGGERQRVVFARSLAQGTDVLLLDEATANLDVRHTIRLLNLAAQKVAGGALVIAVMQDINLAAMYCDRLVCLRQGRVHAQGVQADVLTDQMLQAVFGVSARVAFNTFSEARQVTFSRITHSIERRLN